MDFIRRIVSGPKKRYQEEGYDLDFTYICPRLIAMSFPASGFEQLYRNPIEKVKELIEKRHQSKFLIFNLSNRKYDTSKFNNQVRDFEWEDHHAPPVNTLFEICEQMDDFLMKDLDNVVITHCLAGKGRTGTIICCYLMYSGRFQTPEQVLTYYGRKRFHKDGLGVNQPCQVRYVYYFHEILNKRNIYPTLCYIQSIDLWGKCKESNFKPYVEIIQVKTQEKIYNQKVEKEGGDIFVFEKESKKWSLRFQNNIPICGDILVRLRNDGTIKDSTLVRFSINTGFINDIEFVSEECRRNLVFPLSQLSPYGKKRDKNFSSDYRIELHFGVFCECTSLTPMERKCKICKELLQTELKTWDSIYEILKYYQNPSVQQAVVKLFRHEEVDDVNKVMFDFKFPLKSREEIQLNSSLRVIQDVFQSGIPLPQDELRRKSDSNAFLSLQQKVSPTKQKGKEKGLEKVLEKGKEKALEKGKDLLVGGKEGERIKNLKGKLKTIEQEQEEENRKRSNDMTNANAEEYLRVQQAILNLEGGGGEKGASGSEDEGEESPKYVDASQKFAADIRSKEELLNVIRNKGSNSFFFRSNSEIEGGKANSLYHRSGSHNTGNSLNKNEADQVRKKCQSVQFSLRQGEGRKQGHNEIKEEADEFEFAQGEEEENFQGKKSNSPFKKKHQGASQSQHELQKQIYNQDFQEKQESRNKTEQKIDENLEDSYNNTEFLIANNKGQNTTANTFLQQNRNRQLTNNTNFSQLSGTSEFTSVQPLSVTYANFQNKTQNYSFNHAFQKNLNPHTQNNNFDNQTNPITADTSKTNSVLQNFQNQPKQNSQTNQEELEEIIQFTEQDEPQNQSNLNIPSHDVCNTSMNQEQMANIPYRTNTILVFKNHQQYFTQEFYEIKEEN